MTGNDDSEIVITIRLPTTHEDAVAMIEFVERKSEVLYRAMRDRIKGTRFPMLILDGALDRDKSIYAVAPGHRRIAFVDPDASPLRRIPSATLRSIGEITRRDVSDLVSRRMKGDRGRDLDENGGRDNIIALYNASHLDPREIEVLAGHVLAVGVKYLVLLVSDPNALRVTERAGNVVLLTSSGR